MAISISPSILVDDCWSSSLYLGKDCYCLVFHTECVPILPVLSALGYQSVVGLSGQLVFLTLV